jgi:hypothetical protein
VQTASPRSSWRTAAMCSLNPNREADSRSTSRRLMSHNPSRFTEPQDEPLFTAISQSDPAFQSAYDRAAATIPQFIAHIESAPDAFR